MEEKKSGAGKWAAIIGGVIILILALIAGIYFVNQKVKQNDYTESINSAERYLNEGNYAKAVIEYKNAIQATPKKEGGYLGLASAYVEQGEISQAKITLKKGYLLTNSQRIQYMLDDLETGKLVASAADEKSVARTMELTGDFGWDASLLQRFESFTHADYKKEYGSDPEIATLSKNEAEVVYPGLQATCYFTNTREQSDIIDITKGRPEDTAMPQKIWMDSISTLFQNYYDGVTLKDLQKLSSTKIAPVKTEEMTFVEIKTGSLIVHIQTDDAGNITDENAWNEIILTEANKTSLLKNQYAGVVINATTGDGVSGARVEFEPRTQAGQRAEAVTDGYGAFRLEAKPDLYDVTISAEGFQQETFEVLVEAGEQYSGEKFTITPSLTEGMARIVLEWNAEPRDLDSYLSGTTRDGARVFVYYAEKRSYSGSQLLAELDVDDMSGYGPETTTLYSLDGIFKFSVKDYRGTGTMSQYGATVKVYLPGERSPEVISLAPGSGVQNVWDVFELDHGRLKVLNCAPSEEAEYNDNK